MRIPRLRSVFVTLLVLFAALYLFGAASLALRDNSIAMFAGVPANVESIAIFGASGTAGDGILQGGHGRFGNQEDPCCHPTVNASDRKEGVASGKVQMTRHMDYLDYAAIVEQIADLDAVFWAIGISARGVDETTYGMIHVDFPRQFVETWLSVSKKPDISFHYISSSDISADSSMMWAREKVRAEKTLFGIAEGTNLRVIAYRPDYIGPTDEEAHIGQDILYGFFAPVGAAVRATQIGQAMIEITARGGAFENGDKVGTWNIRRYSDAYEQRVTDTG